MEATDRVLLFLKAPRPGAVKTRLAADLGAEAACVVYRHLAERQLAALAGIASQVEVRFAPADAEPEIRAWLDAKFAPPPACAAQCEGDLGARLAHAAAEAFAAGARRVVLIGADCPALDAARIGQALENLAAGADAVFGPARDGGYYLLALSAPRPELFDRIPWSTTETLRVSLARAADSGLRVALLSEEEDVDDLASLRRACPLLFGTMVAASACFVSAPVRYYGDPS